MILSIKFILSLVDIVLLHYNNFARVVKLVGFTEVSITIEIPEDDILESISKASVDLLFHPKINEYSSFWRSTKWYKIENS